MADVQGDHVHEQTEDPVTRVHLGEDVVHQEVTVDVRQLLTHQMRYYEAVLVETGQQWLVHVTQLQVLDQSHQQPERDLLVAVVEEGARDEVHALHITEIRIISGECQQDPFQLFLPSHFLELLALGESPSCVFHDLFFVHVEFFAFDEFLIQLLHLTHFHLLHPFQTTAATVINIWTVSAFTSEQRKQVWHMAFLLHWR